MPRLPHGCYSETDRLSQIAWDTFGTIPPGWGRVPAICDFVQARIRFDYMQAQATRTAFEAFHERVGCAATSLIWRSLSAAASMSPDAM
jgi:hypothetical protein